MKKIFFLACGLFVSLACLCNAILVKNIEELKKANSTAAPGDIVVLQNGNWSNVRILLTASGTADQPITFKAQTPGKVFITGNSFLKIGGNYLVVEGLYFRDGFAGDNPVIDFRVDKKQLANNCRVTNTVIESFNNPKRMDENYWIQFYGKRNRIDHCSFSGKLNMGVLLAVILDDERSRENFHSIDHNYFGQRLPLASNSGEIMRVGVSQHCEFNSNTQITDNYFEHCDGETEIVSIKSCSNVVRNNLFKECQGGVVLRHGNYNTVENNIFLGNNKEGTGGVRVINKGQWVVNNLFYECRGVGFRSPLSIMNGVPNSPAHRYVAVTEAVIANNSFVNCTPISLCEGSDTERSVIPSRVFFGKNIFYNTRDSKIYNAYDDISGIDFATNIVSSRVGQELNSGFTKAELSLSKEGIPSASPYKGMGNHIYDSVKQVAATRLSGGLPSMPGFTGKEQLLSIENNAYWQCGASFSKSRKTKETPKVQTVYCADGPALQKAVNTSNYQDIKIIWLTGTEYVLTEPLNISGDIRIRWKEKKGETRLTMTTPAPYCIQVSGRARFTLEGIPFNLSGNQAQRFITTDTSGSSSHSNIIIKNCRFLNFEGTFLYASKSTASDSIVIRNNLFSNNKGKLFDFYNENDKKGYYNVEQLIIEANRFEAQQGQLLTMLRGGNDESTMGPLLAFRNNKIDNCNSGTESLILLNGTQRSFIEKNNFNRSNTGGTSLEFTDAVRAVHTYQNNSISQSGKVIRNKFVDDKNNVYSDK